MDSREPGKLGERQAVADGWGLLMLVAELLEWRFVPIRGANVFIKDEITIIKDFLAQWQSGNLQLDSDSAHYFADEITHSMELLAEAGLQLVLTKCSRGTRGMSGEFSWETPYNNDPGPSTRLHFDQVHVPPDMHPFAVNWFRVAASLIADLRRLVSEAKTEVELHQFVSAHPVLLALHCRGGHGRWVMDKPRLGREYIPDFMVAGKDSLGFHWTAVELESPTAIPFMKDANPSKSLRLAIAQVHSWRSWLAKNREYASRSKSQHGLGLHGIYENVPGLIIIGRDNRFRGSAISEVRRRLVSENAIEVRSWDWLVRSARQHLRRNIPH